MYRDIISDGYPFQDELNNSPLKKCKKLMRKKSHGIKDKKRVKEFIFLDEVNESTTPRFGLIDRDGSTCDEVSNLKTIHGSSEEEEKTVKTVMKISQRSKKISKSNLSNKSTHKVKGSLKERKDSFFAVDSLNEKEDDFSESDSLPKIILKTNGIEKTFTCYNDSEVVKISESLKSKIIEQVNQSYQKKLTRGYAISNFINSTQTCDNDCSSDEELINDSISRLYYSLNEFIRKSS